MSAMAVYTVGTKIQLDASFANEEGEPVDPDAVTCQVMLPNGTTDDVDTDRVSTGVWLAYFTVALNGLHQYRFVGAGTIDTANEDFFMGQTVFPTE